MAWLRFERKTISLRDKAIESVPSSNEIDNRISYPKGTERILAEVRDQRMVSSDRELTVVDLCLRCPIRYRIRDLIPRPRSI